MRGCHRLVERRSRFEMQPKAEAAIKRVSSEPSSAGGLREKRKDSRIDTRPCSLHSLWVSVKGKHPESSCLQMWTGCSFSDRLESWRTRNSAWRSQLSFGLPAGRSPSLPLWNTEEKTLHGDSRCGDTFRSSLCKTASWNIPTFSTVKKRRLILKESSKETETLKNIPEEDSISI